jgi:hypothetical protein
MEHHWLAMLFYEAIKSQYDDAVVSHYEDNASDLLVDAPFVNSAAGLVKKVITCSYLCFSYTSV